MILAEELRRLSGDARADAREEASALIDSMEAQVKARWYPVARAAGVSEADW